MPLAIFPGTALANPCNSVCIATAAPQNRKPVILFCVGFSSPVRPSSQPGLLKAELLGAAWSWAEKAWGVRTGGHGDEHPWVRVPGLLWPWQPLEGLPVSQPAALAP